MKLEKFNLYLWTSGLTIESASSWSSVHLIRPATSNTDIATQAEIWAGAWCTGKEGSRDGDVVNRVDCIVSSLKTHITKGEMNIGLFTLEHIHYCIKVEVKQGEFKLCNTGVLNIFSPVHWGL